jgi:hypothetical protein
MAPRGGKAPAAAATRSTAAQAAEQQPADDIEPPPRSPSDDLSDSFERLERLEAKVAKLPTHADLQATLQEAMALQQEAIATQFQQLQLLLANRSPRTSRHASPRQSPRALTSSLQPISLAIQTPAPVPVPEPTSPAISSAQRSPNSLPEKSLPPPAPAVPNETILPPKPAPGMSRARPRPIPPAIVSPYTTTPAIGAFSAPFPPPLSPIPSRPPPLPGPRLQNGHLDLDRLTQPRIGPIYEDTPALADWVRRSWADVIAADDLAYEADLRSAKNAARPFITSIKFASVSDPSTLKNLASVQAQLEAELTPYTSWPLRVRLLFEDDFYLIQQFILLQRPTWLLIVEAILEILQLNNRLESPLIALQSLNNGLLPDESTYQFVRRLRTCFYNLGFQLRQEEHVRQTIKAILLRQVPEIYNRLSFEDNLNRPTGGIVEAAVSMATRLAQEKVKNNQVAPSGINLDFSLPNPQPNLSNAKLTVAPLSQEDANAALEQRGPCYYCGALSHWVDNCPKKQPLSFVSRSGPSNSFRNASNAFPNSFRNASNTFPNSPRPSALRHSGSHPSLRTDQRHVTWQTRSPSRQPSRSPGRSSSRPFRRALPSPNHRSPAAYTAGTEEDTELEEDLRDTRDASEVEYDIDLDLLQQDEDYGPDSILLPDRDPQPA